MRLGPESAGSVPGPACYGNGGEAATVTDANVVLGDLDAGAFMGGRRPLKSAASEAAVDRVANSLGLSRLQAAAGIYRMINLKMADGIRLMTLRRGVDPRRFTLLSFGGRRACMRSKWRANSISSASSCRPRHRCCRPGAC